MAEAIVHPGRRGAFAQSSAFGLGVGRIVGMAQFADVLRPDLVLAPAEHRGPRGIHAEKIAVEIRDAEQIIGDAPDALALPRPLGDLRFERVVELDQCLFARAQRRLRAHPLSRLDHRGQHAADAGRLGLVGHGAVAQREAHVLPLTAPALHPPWHVLGEERGTASGQDVLVERSELVIDLRPSLAQRSAQGGRVLLAEDRPIAVVVDQDQLGSPAQRLREPGGEHQADRPFERRRPMFRRAERGPGPVEFAHPACHLAFALPGGRREPRRDRRRCFGGCRHHDRGLGRWRFENGLHRPVQRTCPAFVPTRRSNTEGS